MHHVCVFEESVCTCMLFQVYESNDTDIKHNSGKPACESPTETDNHSSLPSSRPIEKIKKNNCHDEIKSTINHDDRTPSRKRSHNEPASGQNGAKMLVSCIVQDGEKSEGESRSAVQSSLPAVVMAIEGSKIITPKKRPSKGIDPLDIANKNIEARKALQAAFKKTEKLTIVEPSSSRSGCQPQTRTSSGNQPIPNKEWEVNPPENVVPATRAEEHAPYYCHDCKFNCITAKVQYYMSLVDSLPALASQVKILHQANKGNESTK